MTYVNTEEMARAASKAQSAANDMYRAAGTAEEAARSLRCLFEEGYGSPALELLELLRSQQGNLVHENQQLSAELDALGKLLPGPKYMDLPDGGFPTIGEQITRMITDLVAQIELLQAAINKNCVSPDGEVVPDWVAELDLCKTNALRVVEGKAVLAAVKYCNQHLAFLGGCAGGVAQEVVTVAELVNYAELLSNGF